MKITHTQTIDVEVVFDTHKAAIEHAARSATLKFYYDGRQERYCSDDFYNEMLLEGVHYIIAQDLMDKSREDITNILKAVFENKQKEYRRKTLRRRNRMNQLGNSEGWHNPPTSHPLKEAVAEFLASVPPDVLLICETIMEQEKKVFSRAEASRQLGLSEYELKKKLQEIRKMYEIFSDF